MLLSANGKNDLPAGTEKVQVNAGVLRLAFFHFTKIGDPPMFPGANLLAGFCENDKHGFGAQTSAHLFSWAGMVYWLNAAF